MNFKNSKTAFLLVGTLATLLGFLLIGASIATWGYLPEWGDPPTYIILLIFGLVIALIGIGYILFQVFFHGSVKTLSNDTSSSSQTSVQYVINMPNGNGNFANKNG